MKLNFQTKKKIFESIFNFFYLIYFMEILKIKFSDRKKSFNHFFFIPAPDHYWKEFLVCETLKIGTSFGGFLKNYQSIDKEFSYHLSHRNTKFRYGGVVAIRTIAFIEEWRANKARSSWTRPGNWKKNFWKVFLAENKFFLKSGVIEKIKQFSEIKKKILPENNFFLKFRIIGKNKAITKN